MWDVSAEPGAETGVASPAPPGPAAALEFALAPDDLLALARLPGLTRRAPGRPVSLVWHDNPACELGADALTLVHADRMWRLERLRPQPEANLPEADWPAAAPAPVLGEAASPASLRPAPPFDCAPIAAFAGRSRSYALPGTELQLLHGSLRSVVGERAACRLTLTGSVDAVAAAAAALAVSLTLSVPRATLALEAMAVATGAPLPPRHLGAAAVPGDWPVSDGLAHVIGHLLDVLLHWADRCRVAAEPDAVHQARVATRRLRSALSIYKRAAPSPELDALAAGLKRCASRLGAARDWDVFLDGAGARLASGDESDPRITLLLRTAQRRRNEAYAELRTYLAGPEFRALETGLGCAAALRPWERVGDPAALRRETAAFAAGVLDRRFRRVRKAARGLADLPIPALHELRKDCKRLRYATEFFAPGFPKSGAKAFGRRLASLQEELGHLNDGAQAAALMARLGRVGRGYAGGLMDGLARGQADTARERIRKAWKRFRAETPFWRA